MVCQAYTNVIMVEFTQQFGSQHPLVAQIDQTMLKGGGQVSVSADGLAGSALIDASGVLYTSVKGTKEHDPCANRGVCTSSSGVCSCYNTNGNSYGSSNGYGAAGQRGDCGFITSGLVVSSCPGALQCSGHGVCNKGTFRCACDNGWSAGDCSLRTCPTELSWFDYPSAQDTAHITYDSCSRMGICDATLGKCTCYTGFTGQACEFLGCPGLATTPCSGQGRCMTMAELALWAEDNGDATSYTYGLDPNNPMTWDANRILGCYCDKGFGGYDCSVRTCLRGDDPGTYDDHNEVQFLQCIATGGTFVLSFRQQRTNPIPFNATFDVIQTELEALSTLSKLTVTFGLDSPPPLGTLSTIYPPMTEPQGMPSWAHFNVTSRMVDYIPEPIPLSFVPSSACDSLGSQLIIISFDTTHGPLPPLQADILQLDDSVNNNGLHGTGVITVFTDGMIAMGLTSIQGTTENAVCNNRGVCNEALGVCSCFPTWSSSDGQGNAGNVGDCAYRNDQLNGNN